jgi:hypothetical protein
MRIYYTAVDQGDGSLGVRFYESQECIELMEQYDLEGFRGEGGFFFDVEGSHNIDVKTMDDVVQTLKEFYGVEALR